MPQQSAPTNETLAGTLWNETPEDDAESFSTDDTADDLVGAGRTLGNVYNFIGRWVESTANKLGEKMKLGPKATYTKIEETRLQLLGNSATSLQDVVVPKSAGKKLQKYLKALLKYAKCTKNSNIISTQRAALEYIIVLATHDVYFRAQFEILESANLLRQNYEELLRFEFNSARDTTQLQSRSRKALIAVSEVDIGRTLSDLKRAGFFLGPKAVQCYAKLFNFLSDADVSFIAARHMAKRGTYYTTILPTLHIHNIDLFGILNKYIETQLKQPGDMLPFEWDSLDKILLANIDLYQRGNARFPTISQYLLRALFCFADKLPMTVKDQKQRLGRWLDQVTLMMADVTIVNNPKMWNFLPWLLTSALSGKNLANLSQKERQILRNTYRDLALKSMWKTVLQKPYAALYSICSSRCVQILDHDLHGYITMEKVADPGILREMCTVLGRLCYSKSTKRRKLAMKVMHLVGRLDRYCKAAALQGLETATDPSSFATHVKKISSGWDREVAYAMIHPNTRKPKDSHFLIIVGVPYGPIYCRDCRECNGCYPKEFDAYYEEIGHEEHTITILTNGERYLFVRKKALLWLEIPKGATFRSEGHYPVRIGTRDGKEVHIAAPLPREKTPRLLSLARAGGSDEYKYIGPMARLGSVADGDNSMLMVDESGKLERLKDFCVLVYRYELFDLHRESTPIGENLVFRECGWQKWAGCVGCEDYRRRHPGD